MQEETKWDEGIRRTGRLWFVEGGRRGQAASYYATVENTIIVGLNVYRGGLGRLYKVYETTETPIRCGQIPRTILDFVLHVHLSCLMLRIPTVLSGSIAG